MGIQVETRRSAGGGNWSMNTKLCDSCKSATALLFCRADSAFLCMTCDSNIHSANKLASRHERVWMCEVCESAPASVTCKADAASLCVTCDADIHSANPLARRHERVPVVPFFESAISAAASAGNNKISSDLNFLLVPDHFVKGQPNEVVEEDEDDVVDVKTTVHHKGGDDDASWLFQNPPSSKLGVVVEAVPDLMLKSGIGVGGVDYLFSDVDSYLDLDYPDIGGEKQFQNQHQHHNQNGSAGSDSVVPVATNPIQNHPAASFNYSENHCYEFDFSKPKPAYSFNTQSVSHSVSSSEVGVVPDSSNCNSMTDISNPFSRNNGMIIDHHHGVMSTSNGMIDTNTVSNGVENAVVVTQLTGLDREARVLRYREKRKNRKFEKTIRYASRKAYAETRPRIKGRFAKRTETEIEADNQMERMYHSNNPSSGGFVIDSGYGIVPSF
ncbi:hypothetical protein C5167_014841 [Papaver somniferum]|uniref:Uncharacterized protein n=1 Tax=Papaver somniferum TaxID=3469 RepID=A0A4Y7J7E9_PAPSO|nr:zinc finger protein CONSTANS-LIKE 4-like [Papaver somniferum]RZC55982.1 hypothetical protein C5167_014841 [Papaver somniferum]